MLELVVGHDRYLPHSLNCMIHSTSTERLCVTCVVEKCVKTSKQSIQVSQTKKETLIVRDDV